VVKSVSQVNAGALWVSAVFPMNWVVAVMFGAVRRFEAKVKLEAEVILVPSKYVTPLVVWLLAFVPPRAMDNIPVVSASAIPSVEVALSVYPLEAFPTRSCPYEGAEVSPVPPYTTPRDEVATMVPLALVVRSELASPESVVAPVLETLNSVVVAEAVEEPMAKSVLFVLPSYACTESFANGEVVPTPTFPVVAPSTESTGFPRAGSVPVLKFQVPTASAECVLERSRK
jgi:hypothetical protein